MGKPSPSNTMLDSGSPDEKVEGERNLSVMLDDASEHEIGLGLYRKSAGLEVSERESKRVYVRCFPLFVDHRTASAATKRWMGL